MFVSELKIRPWAPRSIQTVIFFTFPFYYSCYFFFFGSSVTRWKTTLFKVMQISQSKKKNRKYIYIYIYKVQVVQSTTLGATDGYLIEMSVVWVRKSTAASVFCALSSSLHPYISSLLLLSLFIYFFSSKSFCQTALRHHFASEHGRGGAKVHQVRAPKAGRRP